MKLGCMQTLRVIKKVDFGVYLSDIDQPKVAWIPRNWQKVSQDTGIGNPKKASAGTDTHR